MGRTVVFVHGRGPKRLPAKETEWGCRLKAALEGSTATLEFASYSNEAYGGLPSWLGPVLLLYDLLRWFFPWPGRAQRRLRLAQRLSQLLRANAGGDVLIIAHSFGSVLAYELLLKSSADDLPMIWLITVGSPLSWVPSLFLGMDKVAPPNQAVKRWANMFHHADPVAGTRLLSPFFRDNTLADDYRASPSTAPEQPVDWAIYHFEADPHDDNGYLHSRSVQKVARAFATGQSWPFDAITQP